MCPIYLIRKHLAADSESALTLFTGALHLRCVRRGCLPVPARGNASRSAGAAWRTCRQAGRTSIGAPPQVTGDRTSPPSLRHPPANRSAGGATRSARPRSNWGPAREAGRMCPEPRERGRAVAETPLGAVRGGVGTSAVPHARQHGCVWQPQMSQSECVAFPLTSKFWDAYALDAPRPLAGQQPGASTV